MPTSRSKKRKNPPARSNKTHTGGGSGGGAGGSFVENLELLRQFCPDYEEKDLSCCLRDCGYNVDLAATKLLTGEWTKAPKGRSGSFFHLQKQQSSSPSSKGNKRPKAPTKTKSTAAPHVQPQRRQETPRLESKLAPKTVTPSTVPRTAAPLKPPPSPKFEESDGDSVESSYLLCIRWLDGSSLTRNGQTQYKESFQISSSKSGRPVLRFKGSRVEGTLPAKLNTIMAPLARQGLIQLRAQALMSNKRTTIGQAVPMSLSVYISKDIRAFFALFDNGGSGASNKPGSSSDSSKACARSQFFANKHATKNNSSNKVPRDMDKMDLAEAAFQLLQWAEYGDAPEFKRRTSENDNDDGENESMSDEEDDAEKEAIKAGEVVADGSVALDLVEAHDPPGFKDDITLRPYQRQALHWMYQRETEQLSRDVLEKELQLLTELAPNGNKQHKHDNMYLPPRTEKGITCECGPVRVSENGKAKAVTLDGEINPLNHPLWQSRYLASPDPQKAVIFYVNEVIGSASALPPTPPKLCNGGILADAMGLGKTVMLLALILKGKVRADRETDKTRSTLVVAPLSLISQWDEEIASKTNLTHKLHYGEAVRGVSQHTFRGTDVVVTTYRTLQSELARTMDCRNGANNTGLLGYDWFRVILDEAHEIKNPSTLNSKACCMLKAQRRWAVTGTPIQNSLQDVYALMKFLKHEPWNEHKFWRAAITSSIGLNQGMQLALQRVRRLLAPIILRRTKETMNKDGEPILTLPPMECKVVDVHLSGPEREFYAALKQKSRCIFEGIVNDGAFGKSYFKIFSLLNRLRQACDHVALTVKGQMDDREWNPGALNDYSSLSKTSEPESGSSSDGVAVGENFMESLLEKFVQTKDGYTQQIASNLTQVVSSGAEHISDECPICLETPKVSDTVLTPCRHMFCRDCLVGFLKDSGKEKETLKVPDGHCPVCKTSVEAKKIVALSQMDGKTETKYLLETKVKSLQSSKSVAFGAREMLENALKGAGSSKLAAVIDELNSVWREDPGGKVLIYSQFLGFLDLLGVALKKNGTPFGRLDGSLTWKQRVAVVSDFKQPRRDGKGSVLLLSMKAGGVGLNLVAASACFIVDPWWNMATEEQCINRIHRIGQDAPVVRVRKFVVKHSVEERIVELQKRKKDMAVHVLSDGPETLESADRASIEDFKLLFGGL